jgi:ornithine decarboxylase
MSLGVSPDRIIYANPCKLPRHLAAVSASGVGMTTFDSAGELAKIAALAPDMRVLLRLRADDPDARCVLGNKYGAEPAEVEPLLLAAKALGVKVAGCAFHVGSGATNPLAFREALEYARVANDWACPRWTCWTSAAAFPARSPRARRPTTTT